MSAIYVCEKPQRKYNDPQVFIHRGVRVTYEAFAKSGACRNLAPQTKANYGTLDFKKEI